MDRRGPYSYEIVPFDAINPQDYLTLSTHAVLHYNAAKGTDCLSVHQWKKEQELYASLIQVPFFSNYPKWRMIALWKTAMREMRFRHISTKPSHVTPNKPDL